MKSNMINSPRIAPLALLLSMQVHAVSPTADAVGQNLPPAKLRLAPGAVTAFYKAGVQVVEVAGAQGLQITQLQPGNPFANAGFEIGDKVLAVNTFPTNSVAVFGDAIGKSKGLTEVLVLDHNTGRLLVVNVIL
jgi:S1-C subfamily serine protease